jgi:hypothetical protein
MPAFFLDPKKKKKKSNKNGDNMTLIMLVNLFRSLHISLLY